MKFPTKLKKWLLGLGTLFPFLYLPLFAAFFFSMAGQQAPTNQFPPILGAMLALHFLVSIGSIVLLVIYIRDMIHNQTLTQERKLIWIVCTFFGTLIAMPIYFFVHIFPRPTSS